MEVVVVRWAGGDFKTKDAIREKLGRCNVKFPTGKIEKTTRTAGKKEKRGKGKNGRRKKAASGNLCKY